MLEGQYHIEIKPFDIFVETSILYNFKNNYNYLEKAKVFAVSSYEGHALTFQILVNDSFVFSYVPIHMIHSKESFQEEDLCDLVYDNCGKGRITVNYYSILKEKGCYVWSRDKKDYELGKYIFTVDWIDDNISLHMIELNNGNYCLWPSHKLVFGNYSELPNYEKLRSEWKIKK